MRGAERDAGWFIGTGVGLCGLFIGAALTDNQLLSWCMFGFGVVVSLFAEPRDK